MDIIFSKEIDLGGNSGGGVYDGADSTYKGADGYLKYLGEEANAYRPIFDVYGNVTSSMSEDAATNTLSAYLDLTTWGRSSGASCSDDETGPDQKQNAYLFGATAGAERSLVKTVSTTGIGVFSLFVAQGSGEVILNTYTSPSSNTSRVVFDTDTGSYVSATGDELTAEDWSVPGFYRIGLNNAAGNIDRVKIAKDDGGSVICFGAMYEAGVTTMTSYTPTARNGVGGVDPSFTSINYSSIPFQQYPEYTASTYAVDDYAQLGGLVYKSAKNTNNDTIPVGLVADPPSWVYFCPTNRNKMFNLTESQEPPTVFTATYSTTEVFRVQFQYTDTSTFQLSLHGLFGDTMDITIVHDGGTFTETNIDISEATGQSQYISEALDTGGVATVTIEITPINIVNNPSLVQASDFSAEIGKCIIGEPKAVGSTLNEPVISIIDLSTTTRTNGITSRVVGDQIDQVDYTFVSESLQNHRTRDLIKRLNQETRGHVFIGDAARFETVVFGFVSDWKMATNVADVTFSSLQVTGL